MMKKYSLLLRDLFIRYPLYTRIGVVLLIITIISVLALSGGNRSSQQITSSSSSSSVNFEKLDPEVRKYAELTRDTPSLIENVDCLTLPRQLIADCQQRKAKRVIETLPSKPINDILAMDCKMFAVPSLSGSTYEKDCEYIKQNSRKNYAIREISAAYQAGDLGVCKNFSTKEQQLVCEARYPFWLAKFTPSEVSCEKLRNTDARKMCADAKQAFLQNSGTLELSQKFMNLEYGIND